MPERKAGSCHAVVNRILWPSIIEITCLKDGAFYLYSCLHPVYYITFFACKFIRSPMLQLFQWTKLNKIPNPTA